MCLRDQHDAFWIKLMLFLSIFNVPLQAQTPHSVTLTWDDTLNPSGTTYNIYRAVGLCSGAPAFSKIAAAIATKTYTDTSVTSGDYCYEVTATLNGTESAPSNTALAPVPFLPVPAPTSSLTITSNPAAPTVGQSVTLIASVATSNGSSPATGTVQFFDSARSLGTSAVAAGQAQIATTLSAGQHVISGIYSGDSTYPPASSPIYDLFVNRLTTSLILTSNGTNTAFGQPILFTATLSFQSTTGNAPPTGQVQFYSACLCGEASTLQYNSLLGTASISNGAASVSVATLSAGSSQVVAVYSGDGNWNAAASNLLAETIAKASTNTAWTSLTTDLKQIILTASVSVPLAGSIAPTGSVQFIDTTNSAALATSALAGNETAKAAITAQQNVLTHPLSAVYSGDENFTGSTSVPLPLIAITDSAGYGTVAVAPDEDVSIFGAGFASALSTSDPSQVLTSLAGVSVQIKDAMGTGRLASLLLVSPSQINAVIPAGTALGAAMVTVNTSGPSFSRPIPIASVAPGLFAANGRGEGPAAAQVVRVLADGSQEVDNTAVWDAANQQWVAAPIQLASEPVYLVLYGTGIRHRSSNDAVTSVINGLSLPVTYAGPQSQFPGLDQVDVLLPSTLAGSGEAQVAINVDGQVSNTVTLLFQ